jgi:hypothetical protein
MIGVELEGPCLDECWKRIAQVDDIDDELIVSLDVVECQIESEPEGGNDLLKKRVIHWSAR